MKSIKKMFDQYAKNPDWELEELERSVIEAVESRTVFIAVVNTYYEVTAVADTSAKARNLALKKAMEFLKDNGTAQQYGYRTLKDIEDNLGCNITEVKMNSATIE